MGPISHLSRTWLFDPLPLTIYTDVSLSVWHENTRYLFKGNPPKPGPDQKIHEIICIGEATSIKGSYGHLAVAAFAKNPFTSFLNNSRICIQSLDNTAINGPKGCRQMSLTTADMYNQAALETTVSEYLTYKI